MLCESWAERRLQGRFAVHHSVLENDAADDDGDGGGELADETECRRCGSDVAGLDIRLERDEGGLEVRTNAYAGDDLEGEDAAPGAAAGEVDVETETKGHEDDAEVDWREVLACFLDEDADYH